MNAITKETKYPILVTVTVTTYGSEGIGLITRKLSCVKYLTHGQNIFHDSIAEDIEYQLGGSRDRVTVESVVPSNLAMSPLET